MNLENNIKIFYPACGNDFWNSGGLGGSLNLIREALEGNGPISDKVPNSLDIVYCDINPNIDIEKINYVVNRLFRNRNNHLSHKYFSKTTSQLNFQEDHEDNFPTGWNNEWKTFIWMFELMGEINGVNIRFRYFSTSYQQTICYLLKTGWKLEDDDVILLGSNWRYYGEGGQNLHTIFQEPLNQFFDSETKVITRSRWNQNFENEHRLVDNEHFSIRRFSQGFWEVSYE